MIGTSTKMGESGKTIRFRDNGELLGSVLERRPWQNICCTSFWFKPLEKNSSFTLSTIRS
jgi:hypothetical protein